MGAAAHRRHARPLSSLLRLKAGTFAVLCPVHFCRHPAFTACPLLWTPCFYCLSTFVDTLLLLPVHFCGHYAFTVCPVLRTLRFYRLSGFADTTLLPPVRFCGHRAFTVCPVLWTPCFLLSVRFCGNFPLTATQNSSILEFSMTHFCA